MMLEGEIPTTNYVKEVLKLKKEKIKKQTTKSKIKKLQENQANMMLADVSR